MHYIKEKTQQVSGLQICNQKNITGQSHNTSTNTKRTTGTWEMRYPALPMTAVSAVQINKYIPSICGTDSALKNEEITCQREKKGIETKCRSMNYC